MFRLPRLNLFRINPISPQVAAPQNKQITFQQKANTSSLIDPVHRFILPIAPLSVFAGFFFRWIPSGEKNKPDAIPPREVARLEVSKAPKQMKGHVGGELHISFTEKPAVSIDSIDGLPLFTILRKVLPGNMVRYEIIAGCFRHREYIPSKYEICHGRLKLPPKSRYRLRDGDVIKAGELEYIFHTPVAEERISEAERRDRTRTPLSMRIKFKSDTLDMFIERYSVDISFGGMFIRTKDPLPVGTKVRFEFQLKDSTHLFRGEGTVVWIREYDPSHKNLAPGIGLRFDLLPDASQEILDKILQAKGEGPQIKP